MNEFEENFVEEFEEITQVDCWTVINSFFKEKGLVTQQLDSFDEFIQNTIQEIVDDDSKIIHQSVNQHTGVDDTTKQYTIEFGQIYLSKAMMTEADGSRQPLFPHEARLRNLTYAVPLYVDMKKEVRVADPNHPENVNAQHLSEMVWEIEQQDEDYQKVFLGNVPLMLKSSYCTLYDKDDSEMERMGECPYDQGGYFIINGSEKVLIAQERMATNHVYVFAKAQPSTYSYSSEIRSQMERGNKVASPLFIKMMASKIGEKAATGQYIRTSLPYIKVDIPIVIVFRALGIVADRDILEHICYDFNDHEMLSLLKPCIEEAFVIQGQEIALDYIG
jgi:DNA-directed RNA polymerase II subunit RPB2